MTLGRSERTDELDWQGDRAGTLNQLHPGNNPTVDIAEKIDTALSTEKPEIQIRISSEDFDSIDWPAVECYMISAIREERQAGDVEQEEVPEYVHPEDTTSEMESNTRKNVISRMESLGVYITVEQSTS